MEGKEPPNIDAKNRYRKFGLPNWMVNNIERLNFATDFEQYACSPPENEGFLTENIENCDLRDAPLPVIVNELPEDKPKIVQDVKSISESKSTPNLLAKATEQLASLSIIENMKQEELYSSPDTTPCATPCATPEPSPLIRRRLSGQMQPDDSVQTNPGRWFYLGNFKKPDPNIKGQNLNAINKKVNKVKQVDKTSDLPIKIKSPIKQKKEGMKLVISNFDINAISPSSW